MALLSEAVAYRLTGLEEKIGSNSSLSDIYNDAHDDVHSLHSIRRSRSTVEDHLLCSATSKRQLT